MRLSRTAGTNGHRCRADHHGRPLDALGSVLARRRARMSTAKSLLDDDWREPDLGRCYAALRASVSGGNAAEAVGNFIFAVDLARSGKLGKLRTFTPPSPITSADRPRVASGEPEPPKEKEDWTCAGPAPWRPYNQRTSQGLGHGCAASTSMPAGFLNWASHTVDLCQWANQADGTTPWSSSRSGRSAAMRRNRRARRYAMEPNGSCAPMMRRLAQLGSCSVRFEGRRGWVETGDSGKIALYPESLRTERTISTDVHIDAESHVPTSSTA